MPEISEKNFESTIDSLLLAGGPDSPIQSEAGVREVATADGEYVPGSFRKRLPTDYDKSLCLIPQDLFDFLTAWFAKAP